MNENEALAAMIPPGAVRPGKYRGGVIQVHATRACDRACFNCTQGSHLQGKARHISVEGFEACIDSLKGYWGVVGLFGGNPALHPHFPHLCAVLRARFPREQLGLWCNRPFAHAPLMRQTFDPRVSNLNVHGSAEAFQEFKRGWPESLPFGLEDCRHSPPWVAMKDVIEDEGERWELIAGCDINRHWSAMLGEFRGQPRAWFCEIAGAQSILHQDEEDYPDTGLYAKPEWWRLPMAFFAEQVRKHCHECGVPLRLRGALANTGPTEQVSKTHAAIYRPRGQRPVEVVTQLSTDRLGRFTDYMGNAAR